MEIIVVSLSLLPDSFFFFGVTITFPHEFPVSQQAPFDTSETNWI
jgi:hypothetical protein